MAEAKMIIKSADQNGNSASNTYSAINPALASSEGFVLLQTVAHSMLGLSNNTYNSAQLVLTYDIDEEADNDG